MFTFETGQVVNPRYIINFPTKRHWRGKSRIEDIESGLRALSEETRRLGLQSIAVPPLGCGLGGLNWKVVRELILDEFKTLDQVRLFLYAPAGAPDAKSMPVRTKKPDLTPARAMLLRLMELYLIPAYRLTLLEVQKLAYFLQESGEDLRLRYEAGRYGPYAANLNKVLEALEGHYIRGYGDSQETDADLELLPNSSGEVEKYLREQGVHSPHMTRVGDLIEGFETPYGLELLSSIHWVAMHSQAEVGSAEDATRAIHAWSRRKAKMFRPQHIRVAWQRLEAKGWLVKSEGAA
jgi:O-acetyl-ADP-ribose deacetylase (regulator of RNase III)